MEVREKLVEIIKFYADFLSRDTIDSIVDNIIAEGVTVQQWIPVKDRLPEAETEVLILASRKIYSLKSRSHSTHHTITTGMYEDGTKRTEDSNWWWETDGFEYDEERDDYIIPEGWWEYKHYNGDEQPNYAVDDEVTHWMPLPQSPKGE